MNEVQKAIKEKGEWYTKLPRAGNGEALEEYKRPKREAVKPSEARGSLR